MKTLIFIFLICLSFSGMAQVTANKQVKYPTRSEVNAAFATKSKGDSLQAVIDSLQTVIDSTKLALNGKVDSTDIVDVALYTTAEVDEKTLSLYNLLRLNNSNTKSVPLGADYKNVSACALSDQILYLSMDYVPRDTTVTGIQFAQVTAGNYTPDNTNGVALYSYNEATDTYTKVAESTNDAADPNIWEATANTVVTKAFSAPIHIAKGLYAKAYLANYSGTPTTVAAISGITTTTPVVFSKEFTGLSFHVAAQSSAGHTTFPATITVAETVRSSNSMSGILY